MTQLNELAISENNLVLYYIMQVYDHTVIVPVNIFINDIHKPFPFNFAHVFYYFCIKL